MKPLSLHLENVRTFDVLDFDFPEGALAVTGSNGAGKSTLISAIDVALFGAEGRSLSDWLTKDRPEQTMVIALTFEHGGESYRVRRFYHGKGRGSSSVAFEISHPLGAHDEAEYWDLLTRESAAATQEEIERTIGLTRETFRASAFMAQGQGGLFCEAAPRERKQILASVLGLQVWDGYRERARTDLRAAEQSLAVVRAKIEQADLELAERPGLVLLAAQAKERETAARTALEECGSQLAKARERLSALREAARLREAAERARDAAERSHASLLDRIAGLERQIAEAEARLGEREGLETLAEGLPGLERERDALAEQARGYAERTGLEAEFSRLRAESDAALKNAQDLEQRAQTVLRNPDEKCDRCGQAMHREAAERAAASYRDEADRFAFRRNNIEESELPDLSARMSPLPAEPPDRERQGHLLDLIRLGQDAKQKLAALGEVSQAVTYLRADLKELRSEEPEAKARADSALEEVRLLTPEDEGELMTTATEVRRLEASEKARRAELDDALREIARLDERLARLDGLLTETVMLKEGAIGDSQEVELLSHLERACGPNGVPALILETSAIPQLEAEWNRLLRLLPTDSGDLFEVELHTQREKKTGDGAVDSLDIVVYRGGIPMPYSNYSGGEKMRLAIAQRRALSALLAHRKGADCPFMVLDEPNALDATGTAALVEVLQTLADEEGLTILVVAHDASLRDAFAQSIELVKVDGRSQIVEERVPEVVA